MSKSLDYIYSWSDGLTLRQLDRLAKVNEYLVQEFGADHKIKPSPDSIKSIDLLYSTYEDENDITHEIQVSINLETMVLTIDKADGISTKEVDDDFITDMDFNWLYSEVI